MSMKVQSMVSAVTGGVLVDIKCSLSNNLPNIVIVGSASKAVDEAKERVLSAFKSINSDMLRQRTTMNLTPDDIPKSDSSLDLAMAVSILQTSKQIKIDENQNILNSCPCGFYGASVKPCACILAPTHTSRYQQKLSGPIVDLADSEEITKSHIPEALRFRRPEATPEL